MTAFLWSGGGETCRVNSSLHFVHHNTYVVYEYVSTERCAPSALLLVSRSKPAPVDCCILATARRAACCPRVGREATTVYSCVTIQLIDRSAAACCPSPHSSRHHLARSTYALSSCELDVTLYSCVTIQLFDRSAAVCCPSPHSSRHHLAPSTYGLLVYFM